MAARALIIAIVTASLYGVTDEVHQLFVPFRESSWLGLAGRYNRRGHWGAELAILLGCRSASPSLTPPRRGLLCAKRLALRERVAGTGNAANTMDSGKEGVKMDGKTCHSYLVRLGFPAFIVAVGLSSGRLPSADTQGSNSGSDTSPRPWPGRRTTCRQRRVERS